MSLRELPPELVLRIMRHIGHGFFTQNIRRLTVSKWWFRYAWTIFVEQLSLNRARLTHFARNPAAFKTMLPHLKAITVIAREYCYSRTSPSIVYHDLWGITDAEHSLEGTPDERYSNSPFGHQLRERAKFNSFLEKAAVKLHQCPRLNSVAFQGPATQGARSMYTGSLDGLLSLRHLTSLTVNNIVFRNGFHMCPHIRRRLPSLRRFWYRSHLICEDLLAPLPVAPPLTLQDVVIDLTHPTCRSAGAGWYNAMPKRCRVMQSPHGPNWEDCGHRLEEWATELASQLGSLNTVRVIYPWPYSGRKYSFDGITGVRMKLENGSDWDAEGPVVPERPLKVWDDQEDEEESEGEEEQDGEEGGEEDDEDEN